MRQDGYHYYPNSKRKTQWLCKCDCGNEITVIGSDLRNGHTQSCGCFRKDVTQKEATVHGKSHTQLYRIWCAMKTRCNNPNAENYPNYGGRGIKLCADWENNFDSFYEWSMLHGYKPGLTIERIQVDGNYEPANCKWVTFKEQCVNKTNTKYVTYNGETKSLKEWSDETGLVYSCLLWRINAGWSVEKALCTPSMGKG